MISVYRMKEDSWGEALFPDNGMQVDMRQQQPQGAPAAQLPTFPTSERSSLLAQGLNERSGSEQTCPLEDTVVHKPQVVACELWASLVAQMVNNLLQSDWEIWVRSLGRDDPLEEGMANPSSILAWRIPTDRGAWQATADGGHKELDITERLTLWHFHLLTFPASSLPVSCPQRRALLPLFLGHSSPLCRVGV